MLKFAWPRRHAAEKEPKPMRRMIPFFCLMILSATALGADAQPAPELLPRQADLATSVTQDFPRFYFKDHDREAQLLSRFLWYHFANRLGNSKTLFNKEYLTLADPWLASAMDKQRQKTIQEVHREDLSGTRQDEEGYIFTHQHFSHAHEHGWPFPFWLQIPGKGYEGLTFGWHFQDNGPGWVWDSLRQAKKPQGPRRDGDPGLGAGKSQIARAQG